MNKVYSRGSGILNGCCNTICLQTTSVGYVFGSTIGGGHENIINPNTNDPAANMGANIIGGGYKNSITPKGVGFTGIFAGKSNSITNDFAFIGGGYNNTASGGRSTIGGW